MKCAGGGFDPTYSAQAALDAVTHIMVAAELDHNAPDANWLLPMIQAVGDNMGELPQLSLPSAAYFADAHVRAAGDRIGLHSLTLMRAWRIPAALPRFLLRAAEPAVGARLDAGWGRRPSGRRLRPDRDRATPL
jgi:hypothetical protein